MELEHGCLNPDYCGPGDEDTLDYITQSKPVITLTQDEARALERILLKEYINYEDREAHEVVNKIMKFAREEKTK